MGSICMSQKNQTPEEVRLMEDYKPQNNQTEERQQQDGTKVIEPAQPAVEVKKQNEEEEKKVDEDAQVVKPEQERKRENRKMAKIAAIGDDEQIFENIVKKEKAKSPFDYQLILNAFSQHFIFNQLQPQDQEKIIEKMFYCTVDDHQFVFKQGDQASSYFLIERGQCQIIINDEVKKKIQAPNAFGELALLYNAPRSASVKAIGDCAFWAIDRNTFRRVIEDISLRDYEENKAFILKVKFFDSLTDEQRDAICSVLITLNYKKGEIIVNEGDQANSFFIIKQGSVSAFKNSQELRVMKAGDSFGEQALFQNSTRGATIKAQEEVVKCLALSRDDLTRILGDKIQVIMYNNTQRWALERHPILQKLTKIQIEKIINNTAQKQHVKGDLIFNKGTLCSKLIIVLEGALVEQMTKRKVVEAGQLFGDKFLSKEGSNMVIQEDLVMEGEGILAEIELSQFFDCIGGTLEQTITKNEKNHEKLMKKNDESAKKDYSYFELDQLTLVKKLGAGQFGNVYLVKSKQDTKFYALKCISKAQIVEQNLEKHLAQEKKVLETIQFPLMMQFVRSFKDTDCIYFLVEYIRGMELFDVIREIGLLNTYDSQFYIGSLVLCIEYLHTNSIIYRDIKPENIMIDDKGYMKLIDMGTAKFLKGKSGRTYTIIGTPHYMAPEILTGKGYTYSVDLWSAGVCLYEFMCGGVPYAEDAEDPYEIYNEICKKPLTYPSFLKDRKAKKLMDQLLSKTPELRLGSSYASLKANPWFDHLDWDKLVERELKPPFIPPKSKIISDKEVQKLLSLNKSVTSELKQEQIGHYNKEKAKDPNWDKDY